jgi:hypothetical protein
MSLFSDLMKTFFGGKENELPKPETMESVKPITRKQKNVKVYKNRENTKFNQVKKHLIEKGSIDSWTAINLYGVTRLSAIIFNLRMTGHNIDSIPRTAYDRNKELCNFTTYKYINYNGVN